MSALRLLHLSDTHLLREGGLHFGSVDTRARLDAALERFREVGPLDAVLVSGDCSEDGSEDSYRFLAGRVGAFAAAHGARALYTVGNHDARAAFAAVLGDGAGGPAAPGAPIDALADVAGVSLALLDTQVPGRGYGELPPARVEAAAAAVRAAGRPCVVVLHHPPVPATDRLTHVLELRDPAVLAPLVDTGLVVAFLAGHYHHAATASFRGVPVLVAPAVANVVDTAVGYEDYATLAGWGAQLVTLREGSVTALPVTQTTGPAQLLPREVMLRVAEVDGPDDWRERWQDGAP